jgi:hypothetical protein
LSSLWISGVPILITEVGVAMSELHSRSLWPYTGGGESVPTRTGIPVGGATMVPLETADQAYCHGTLVDGCAIEGSSASTSRFRTTRAPHGDESPCDVLSCQSGRPGSNRRPSAWEADALPTELRPRERVNLPAAVGGSSNGGTSGSRAVRPPRAFQLKRRLKMKRAALSDRPLDVLSERSAAPHVLATATPRSCSPRPAGWIRSPPGSRRPRRRPAASP